MTLISPAPASYAETKLYKMLISKTNAGDGIAERVNTFIETASPLLELTIAGPFKDFTLHNPDHSKKLLHLAGYIIGDSVLNTITPLDCALLILSCYLHDMGMSLSSTERQRIIKSPEFTDALREWTEIWDRIEALRQKYGSVSDVEKNVVDTEIYQLEEAALCRYLRPRHATKERYEELIKRIETESGRSDLFEHRGSSFKEILIEICMSHYQDAGDLAAVRNTYSEKYPRAFHLSGQSINVQFVAAILRLADILDFDRERTPNILFESLGIETSTMPGSQVSLKEWRKHMAVHTIAISQNEIIITADCNHPAIERAVREFCLMIEQEFKETSAVLKRNTPEILQNYNVDLPLHVRSTIRSIGYVYKDLSFRLDQSPIMNLLMGERLYSNVGAAVRELIQNAIDACAVRDRKKTGIYDPQIYISYHTDTEGRTWLEVSDNGIGMDEHVLTNYFFRIGNSYYDSPEFKRYIKDTADDPFCSIARFGIGILSVFMIGDVLEVHTKNTLSQRLDYTKRTIRIEGKNSLAFVTESQAGDQGTKVRIRLNRNYLNNIDDFDRQLAHYLQAFIVRPKYPIEVRLKEKNFRLESTDYFSLRAGSREALAEKNIELVILDLKRWSDKVSGLVILFFAKSENGKLSHLRDKKYLKLNTEIIDTRKVLTGYVGNRLTVNGFVMNLRRVSAVLGKSFKRRFPIVLDIDIKGVADVVFDVSRDRVVGKGALYVRNEIRECILKGLKELGLFERFEDETKSIIMQTNSNDVALVTNEVILEQVLSLVPKEHWPKNFHHLIADKLEISRGVVSRAIVTLFRAGRINAPQSLDPSQSYMVIKEDEQLKTS